MAMRRPELGSLKPGSVGDATLISIKQGQFDYEDVVGEHRSATARSSPKASSSAAAGGIRNRGAGGRSCASPR